MSVKKPLPPIGRVVALPMIVLFTVSFLLIYRSPLEIFPTNETYFGYSAESDGNFETGNSTTSLDSTKSHLTFAYTLGNKSDMPFARLIFHAHQLFRTLNLNYYRTMEITLHPEECSSFVITLFTYVPGFSSPEDSRTHRPYSLICHPVPGKKVYRFPLKDFATPTEWFSSQNLKLENVPKSDWAKMTHLSFSDATLKMNVPLKITLEKIQFKNSIIVSLLESIILPLIYLIGFILFTKKMRKKRNREIKQRLYHPNSAESYTEEEKKRLIDYLNINYSDPLLTLEKIEKQIQLNQFQVSEIISDAYQMRYKQFISQRRISEAKRMLEKTDTPINAIAEKVGYCYSNSFSRVFRESEGMTPNEYRAKFQQNSSDT